MNELQITTTKLEPAKVEFNKEQVLSTLNGILKKYENLIFTEEQTTEIRETLAELRKGRRTADEYRKETKKKLTAPVKEFEYEMKEIVGKFDDVINPINEQLQEYETRRREEKRKEVQAFIDEVVEEYQLEQKYASQLVVEDSYLNKTASTKQTKDTIKFRANNLLNEQKLEIMNRENIESFVRLKNSENNVNLSIVAYLSQLEFKTVDEVKNTIENDVKKEVERNEKQLQEIERKAELEKERIKQEEEKDVIEPVIDDLPFGNIEEVETKEVTYKVYATSDEIKQLENFLLDNDIEFYDLEKELPF